MILFVGAMCVRQRAQRSRAVWLVRYVEPTVGLYADEPELSVVAKLLVVAVLERRRKAMEGSRKVGNFHVPGKPAVLLVVGEEVMVAVRGMTCRAFLVVNVVWRVGVESMEEDALG
jgi:hypothetical protein